MCLLQSDSYEAGLETGNTVFAIIFNVEAVLKLYALRRQYFIGALLVESGVRPFAVT